MALSLFVEGTQQCLLNESWTTESLAFFPPLAGCVKVFQALYLTYFTFLVIQWNLHVCVCVCVLSK